MLRRLSDHVEVSTASGPAAARLAGLANLPAEHQPPWDPRSDIGAVRTDLAQLPPLVRPAGIDALCGELARAQAGHAHVLHIGECAETFDMAGTGHIARRWELYRSLADRLAERTGREVVLVTRMAGQYAKPRSQAVEAADDGTQMLTYRGDAVNDRDPDAIARRPDPHRLLSAYRHSLDTLADLEALTAEGDRTAFVSHEALLRDYEAPLTQCGATAYAGTGHLVWIGDRTRRLWNWHIQWAASITNPVAVKIGPTATGYDVFDLARALDPRHQPGRLSLITRLGADTIAARLDPLLRIVTESRAPVLWQCDPMHANTRVIGGRKTRLLPDLRAEITGFAHTLRAAGAHPAGLHLEVSPDDVAECHETPESSSASSPAPPCDPRLNPAQAAQIIDHFAEAVTA